MGRRLPLDSPRSGAQPGFIGTDHHPSEDAEEPEFTLSNYAADLSALRRPAAGRGHPGIGGRVSRGSADDGPEPLGPAGFFFLSDPSAIVISPKGNVPRGSRKNYGLLLASVHSTPGRGRGLGSQMGARGGRRGSQREPLKGRPAASALPSFPGLGAGLEAGRAEAPGNGWQGRWPRSLPSGPS